jgi:predicted metal-binding protein
MSAPDITIAVCITCRRLDDPDAVPRAGVAFAADVARAAMGTGIKVLPVRCLSLCKRPAAAALMQKDGWTYAFAELDFDADARALVDGAQQLQVSPDGRLPAKSLRPLALQRAMAARFPPFEYPGDEPK